MTTINYSHTIDSDSNNVITGVIQKEGENIQPFTVSESHPNFEKIVEKLPYLFVDNENAEDLNNKVEQIVNLIFPAKALQKKLSKISGSERIRTDGERVYFDGEPIDNSIEDYILRALKEDLEYEEYGRTLTALVRFLEKINTNISRHSRKSLYDFLVRTGIKLYPDGDFLAYKGVNVDGTSIHSGEGIVNGVHYKHAHLPNDVGSVIEFPRSKVDANPQVGCSVGLHVGSYDYARNFAQGKLLEVKVNPRDVVSVPQDCEYQKVRVSRYYVQNVFDLKNDEEFDGLVRDGDCYCYNCGNEYEEKPDACDADGDHCAECCTCVKCENCEEPYDTEQWEECYRCDYHEEEDTVEDSENNSAGDANTVINDNHTIIIGDKKYTLNF